MRLFSCALFRAVQQKSVVTVIVDARTASRVYHVESRPRAKDAYERMRALKCYHDRRCREDEKVLCGIKY